MVEGAICFDTSETKRIVKSMLQDVSWKKDSALKGFPFQYTNIHMYIHIYIYICV